MMETLHNNDTHEYEKIENQQEYEDQLKAINEDVLSRLQDGFKYLRNLVGAGDSVYTNAVHAVNERILEGDFKDTYIDQSTADKGHPGLILGIQESTKNANADWNSLKEEPRLGFSVPPKDGQRMGDALEKMDGDVLVTIQNTVHDLGRFLGVKSDEYSQMIHVINQKILDGDYENAHINKEDPDNQFIEGVGHEEQLEGMDKDVRYRLYQNLENLGNLVGEKNQTYLDAVRAAKERMSSGDYDNAYIDQSTAEYHRPGLVMGIPDAALEKRMRPQLVFDVAQEDQQRMGDAIEKMDGDVLVTIRNTVLDLERFLDANSDEYRHLVDELNKKILNGDYENAHLNKDNPNNQFIEGIKA